MDTLTIAVGFFFALGFIFILKAISIDFSSSLWRENRRLRAALAPIIRHADAPDTAPPLRLSVQDCREIVRKVDEC